MTLPLLLTLWLFVGFTSAAGAAGIRVSWQYPVSGHTAVGFHVYRQAAKNPQCREPWVRLTPSPLTHTTRQYVDTPLEVGTWCWTVTAVDSTGQESAAAGVLVVKCHPGSHDVVCEQK